MNKEELMKNMERCVMRISPIDCDQCPYNRLFFCMGALMKDALDYMKEEEKENNK